MTIHSSLNQVWQPCQVTSFISKLWGRTWNKDSRTRSNFTENCQKIAPGPFLCAQIYLRIRSISLPSRCKFALLLPLFRGLLWGCQSVKFQLHVGILNHGCTNCVSWLWILISIKHGKLSTNGKMHYNMWLFLRWSAPRFFSIRLGLRLQIESVTNSINTTIIYISLYNAISTRQSDFERKYYKTLLHCETLALPLWWNEHKIETWMAVILYTQLLSQAKIYCHCMINEREDQSYVCNITPWPCPPWTMDSENCSYFYIVGF